MEDAFALSSFDHMLLKYFSEVIPARTTFLFIDAQL